MKKKTPSVQKPVARGLVKAGRSWRKANQKASQRMTKGGVKYRGQKAVAKGRVRLKGGGTRRANQRQNAVQK